VGNNTTGQTSILVWGEAGRRSAKTYSFSEKRAVQRKKCAPKQSKKRDLQKRGQVELRVIKKKGQQRKLGTRGKSYENTSASENDMGFHPPHPKKKLNEKAPRGVTRIKSKRRNPKLCGQSASPG